MHAAAAAAISKQHAAEAADMLAAAQQLIQVLQEDGAEVRQEAALGTYHCIATPAGLSSTL